MATAQRLSSNPLLQGAAFLVVSAIGAAALVSALVEADPLPLLILGAAVALPVGVYAGVQALRWEPRYAFGLTVLTVILLCTTFRIREIEDKSVDLQILLRLIGIAAMGVMTAAALALSSRKGWQGYPAPWFVFLFYASLTSLYSLQVTVSLVETVSNLIAFMFVCAYRNRLGTPALVRALIFSCFALCCLSIAAYFLQPKIGRMSDWVNGVFIPTSRLSGVFGAANGAGAAAGLGILLTVLLSDLSRRSSWFYIVLAPMVFCLLMSNNRMSLLTVILCLSYVWVNRGEAPLKLSLLLLAAGVATLVISFFGDAILEGLSRSGSVDEITSGTGRTRIWSVVIDLWWQQPIFGYGEGSAKFILPEHPLLFEAAAHPHNLYLSVLFAGGAVGLVLFLWAIGTTIYRAVRSKAHRHIALLMFPLINGLTEPMIGGLVGFVAIYFYLTTALIHNLDDRSPA